MRRFRQTVIKGKRRTNRALISPNTLMLCKYITIVDCLRQTHLSAYLAGLMSDVDVDAVKKRELWFEQWYCHKLLKAHYRITLNVIWLS